MFDEEKYCSWIVQQALNRIPRSSCHPTSLQMIPHLADQVGRVAPLAASVLSWPLAWKSPAFWHCPLIENLCDGGNHCYPRFRARHGTRSRGRPTLTTFFPQGILSSSPPPPPTARVCSPWLPEKRRIAVNGRTPDRQRWGLDFELAGQQPGCWSLSFCRATQTLVGWPGPCGAAHRRAGSAVAGQPRDT